MTCLAQLVIARKIGAPSYGIYSYVLAWTTFLSYGATLGFNMVLLRFVPAYSSTDRWSLARGVVGFAFRRSFIVSLVIASCEIAIVLALADHMQHELAVSLAIGLATVPLFSLYVLGSATVRALGGVISAISPERLVRDGLLLVLVLLAGMLTATPINATTVLIGLMASSAVTVAILGSSLRKLWPAQMQSADPSYETRDWWQLAIPVMVMIGAEILMSRAGVILLGWSGDTRSAGVFALGLKSGSLSGSPSHGCRHFLFAKRSEASRAPRYDCASKPVFQSNRPVAAWYDNSGTSTLVAGGAAAPIFWTRFRCHGSNCSNPCHWTALRRRNRSAAKSLDHDGTSMGCGHFPADRDRHQHYRLRDRHCVLWSIRRGSRHSRDERDLEYSDGDLHPQTPEHGRRAALRDCRVSWNGRPTNRRGPRIGIATQNAASALTKIPIAAPWPNEVVREW